MAGTMNHSEDLYEILQVSSSAEQDVIEAAYRRLVRRYHPDVNKSPAAEEMTYRLNDAYEVLGDPERRAAYDQHRKPYPVQVTLEEACFGTTQFLNLPGGRRLEVKIPPGVDEGSRIKIKTASGFHNGIFVVVSVQSHPRFNRQGGNLYGEAQISEETANFGGQVSLRTLRGQVALIIPPGTPNGRRFRLTGQGMPNRMAPSRSGDLYITAKVMPPTVGVRKRHSQGGRRLGPRGAVESSSSVDGIPHHGRDVVPESIARRKPWEYAQLLIAAADKIADALIYLVVVVLLVSLLAAIIASNW